VKSAFSLQHGKHVAQHCLPLLRVSTSFNQHLQVYGADHVMVEIKQDKQEASRSSVVSI
jgi:predicted N-formylglutamate amidohydrolase